MADIEFPELWPECRKYLRDRGFDDLQVKRLGLRIMSEAGLENLGFNFPNLKSGIVWHLNTKNGEPTGKVAARLFYHTGFARDPVKFATPANQTPAPYFSPLMDWKKFNHKKDRVIVCESMLKADTAARLGFYAVGLSGIYGYSHKRTVGEGSCLAKDFTLYNWSGMQLYVCFDSKINPDEDNYLSVRRFTGLMENEKAHVMSILLPFKEGSTEDWGLDDYCMEYGDDATRELLASEGIHAPTDMQSEKLRLNGEVAYVKSQGKVIRLEDMVLHSANTFVTSLFANRVVREKDTKGFMKDYSVAKYWLMWTARREVEKLIFSPGKELFVGDNLNMWRGMGCEPKRGDVSLFIRWGKDFFKEDEWVYFLDWLAYPLQHLGEKMNTTLVLIGRQGVGKGYTSDLLSGIYGTNAVKTELSMFERDFNKELDCCQLLIVEEAGQALDHTNKAYTTIKNYTTNKHISIHPKGATPYQVDNHMNMILSGNDINMVKPEHGDRRLLVVEVDNMEHEQSTEYFQPMYDHLEAGGAAEIYWYLKNEYKLSAGFDPKGSAPMTDGKRAMIEGTHSDEEMVLEEYRRMGVVAFAGTLLEGEAVASLEEILVALGMFRSLEEVKESIVRSYSKKLRAYNLERWGKRVRNPAGIVKQFYVIDVGALSGQSYDNRMAYIRNRKISQILYGGGVGNSKW